MAAPLAGLSSSIHDLAGRSSAFDRLMSFAAQDLIFVVLLVFAVLWLRPDGLRAGIAAGAGAAVALVIAGIIGDIHYVARPFIAQHYTPLFVHADDASFPSDHLCALGAIAAGAWFSVRLLGLATAAVAVVVGFARVYAGVHDVADVGAGFLIGAACGTAVWYGLRPLMPLVDRVDAELQRAGLRRRSASGQ